MHCEQSTPGSSEALFRKVFWGKLQIGMQAGRKCSSGEFAILRTSREGAHPWGIKSHFDMQTGIQEPPAS